MTRRIAAALPLALAALAGCATTTDEGPHRIAESNLAPAPAKTGPAELLAPPPAAAPFDPKAFTADMATPAECANAARDLHARNPERGWTALKACIEKGHFPRSDFTDLRLVLNGAWDEELSTRPEAPLMLARLIALRGGDVDGDLLKLQAVRAPVFTLQAAVKQPATYKGRYLILRASLQDADASGGGTTARLVETTLSSAVKEAEVEGKRYGNVSSSSGTWRASATTTNYGSGRAQGSWDRSSASRNTVSNVRYENQKTETGRVALGKLAKPDPFLEPGKDYVFLARFDGVRQSPDDPEDSPPAAVVTIVAYFQPSALLID